MVIQVGLKNVLADYKARKQELDGVCRKELSSNERWDHRQPHFFRRLKPIEGAQRAFQKLEESQYDPCIVSEIDETHCEVWTDQKIWVQRHLPDEADQKLTITHNRNMVRGSILINNRPPKEDTFDRFLCFGSQKYPDWDSVLDELVK